MAHSHETTCPNCGTKVYIYDQPIGGGSGNKSKEQAYCPKCYTLLYEAMTSGHFCVSVISEATNNEMK